MTLDESLYSDESVKKKILRLLCVFQTEALRGWERRPGGRAVLSVRRGPEWEEGKDPQSAGNYHKPQGDEVEYNV